MRTKQKVGQERLDELQVVLRKIPGSKRKTWHLEIFERRDGVDCLTEIIDIRTGKPIRRRQEQKNESQRVPG